MPPTKTRSEETQPLLHLPESLRTVAAAPPELRQLMRIARWLKSLQVIEMRVEHVDANTAARISQVRLEISKAVSDLAALMEG